MSLLKSVRSKLFTSKNKKTKQISEQEQEQDQDNHSNEESNPTTSYPSRNSLSTLNADSRLLSLSEMSLYEKLPSYTFLIKNKDPHDDWLDLKVRKKDSKIELIPQLDSSEEYNPNRNLNDEYSVEKAYLNIQTETKSSCRIINKFSSDCLDDYLIEIGILDESGYKVSIAYINMYIYIYIYLKV